ncbi:MAG: N-acetyltransferase [Rhizobiaceae bacterium]
MLQFYCRKVKRLLTMGLKRVNLYPNIESFPDPMIVQQTVFRIAKMSELDTIVALHMSAFGAKSEGVLVRELISSETTTFSLLAEFRGEIIGHVLLSQIKAPIKAAALAPLAVHAPYREMQIGSELVRHAIKLAKEHDYHAIFVLGDTNYYERFGFSGALADIFKCPWQGRNFMAKELKENALKGQSGTLTYPIPFSELDG